MRIVRWLCVVVVIAGGWISGAEGIARADCDCPEMTSCSCTFDWLVTGGGPGQPAPKVAYRADSPSEGGGLGHTLANRAARGVATRASVTRGYATNNPGAVVHMFDGVPYLDEVGPSLWNDVPGGTFFKTPVVGTGGGPVAQGTTPKVDANGEGSLADPSK